MRFVVFVFLFIFIFPSISSAAYTYVKVAQTNNTNKLNKIKFTLRNIGYSSTHRTTKKSYVIYAGPYKNTRTARYALKKIKRYFPNASVIRTRNKLITKVVKVANIVNVVKQNPKKSTTDIDIKNKKLFIDLAYGTIIVPLSHKGDVDEIYLPNDSGTSYNISVGYTISKHIYATLGFLNANATDVVFNNYYASVNYKFGPYGNFTPFIGGLFGNSQLTWNRNPLDNTTATASNSSNSFFGGTQIGAVYNITKDFSLLINYKCLYMNHQTVITKDSNTSELSHSALQNIQLGVRYSF